MTNLPLNDCTHCTELNGTERDCTQVNAVERTARSERHCSLYTTRSVTPSQTLPLTPRGGGVSVSANLLQTVQPVRSGRDTETNQIPVELGGKRNASSLCKARNSEACRRVVNENAQQMLAQRVPIVRHPRGPFRKFEPSARLATSIIAGCRAKSFRIRWAGTGAPRREKESR